MIIKGVLGRYERWNPVHPTAGTFWGVGLGLGCGVGWGPGFGPEVVGYVGAGCGVGFSVGFTLAGVGIGLPQHGFIRSYEGSGKLLLRARCPFNFSCVSTWSLTTISIGRWIKSWISWSFQ
jgi:hypothetical protein